MSWPYPGDSAIVRARKIAWAYRAVAEEHDPDGVAEMDARFRQWGETWPSPVGTYRPEEYVTTDQAASIAGISTGAISKLRRDGRLTGYRDGTRYFYLVADIHTLATEVRSRRTPKTTVTVHDSGRSVSDAQKTE